MRTAAWALVCAFTVLMQSASGGLDAAPGRDDQSDGERMVVGHQNRTATIEVANFGTIVAMLYEPDAPITTANFIDLASGGFYDGTKFHRIVNDFVIQGGDPNSKDGNPYNDGSGGSGQTIPLEVSANLTHEDGALGMARSSDPDSASSQFYICDGAQNGLDGEYAVFGIVIEGMDVVRAIAEVPTYPPRRPYLSATDAPMEDVVINSIAISEQVPIYADNATAGAGGDGSPLLPPDTTTSVLAAVLAGCVIIAAVLYIRRR